jgi:hypothetical protein
MAPVDLEDSEMTYSSSGGGTAKQRHHFRGPDRFATHSGPVAQRRFGLIIMDYFIFNLMAC